jgi:hypothetical protein
MFFLDIFLDAEDDFSPIPMSCGDCDFETHYESELFLHLKVHIGKEDEVLFNVVLGGEGGCMN